MRNLIFILILSTLSISCKDKKIKKDKGSIDIVATIYRNASKTLEDNRTLIVSKLNYKNDTIIELIPDVDFPEQINNVYFIVDSMFTDIGDISSARKINLKNLTGKLNSSVKEKQAGAMFSDLEHTNWDYINKLTDTILFKKTYMRFQIISPENYTRFYLYKTDTILPYQIYPKSAEKFNSRIERIDTYDKVNDIFISMQLMPKNEWDSEAQQIFDYNNFISKK